MNKLFRSDARDNQQNQYFSDVVLTIPASFNIIVGCVALIAIGIVSFLVFGSYTQRTTVSGQLIPDSGLIKVYSVQRGVVLKKFVAEGQTVERGDALFLLSSERHSLAQENVLQAISTQVRSRLASLQAERSKTSQFQAKEIRAMQSTIAGMEAEQEQLKKLIEGQRRRVEIAVDTEKRYRDLADKGYISREQLQLRREGLLEQQNRQQALERELITLQRELQSQEAALPTLATRHAIQIEQIDRMLASLKQELSETEARREHLVLAPESGVATAVTAEAGQVVEVSRPLVSIVPKNSVLQAVFYVPSAAVGFVEPEDAVNIRYHAYPYQKFGHASGTVLSVSKTAMATTELATIGDLLSNNLSVTEPLYRIIARLDAQQILALGKQHSLQAGMLLEADIMRETRRLYEWVLEPLYSLTGKL